MFWLNILMPTILWQRRRMNLFFLMFPQTNWFMTFPRLQMRKLSKSNSTQPTSWFYYIMGPSSTPCYQEESSETQYMSWGIQIVTAQLQPKTKLVWHGNWCVTHPTTHHHPQQTFRSLPDNLGSWFLVYNLILTQLDEICNKKIGVPSKKIKKLDHFQTT